MISSSICFITNFSKTYFFHAIAEELKKNRAECHWICCNQKLYQFLLKHYPKSNILYINRESAQESNAVLGDFKINELVYGDRVLRHAKKEGQLFLQNIQQPIYNFIKEKQIHHVFGELTWAHEVLIHRMLKGRKELNCRFFNPHVVRIPNQRFAFFEDEAQSKIYEIGRSNVHYDQMLEVVKPDYLKINDQRLQKANSIWGRLDRVKRFLTNENIDSKDPTLISNTKIRFAQQSREELNKELYKSVHRANFEDFKNQPFIFIGLHKQPEASVDVFGRYVEDQSQNIQNIWRVLPPRWNLLIKEHSNAIGDRKPQFYTDLMALPNVHFIDEKTDSYRLIRAAQLVVTITGTIAFEAALMQIPALTFAPTFFNRLSYCRQITTQQLNQCSSLTKLIHELEENEDNRLAFSNYLIKHSFEGFFSDPVSNPSIMNPENVEKVSNAFLHLLTTQKVSLPLQHKID